MGLKHGHRMTLLYSWVFAATFWGQHVFFALATRLSVVIDVGSTGSRAHVFEWTYVASACGGDGGVKVVLPEESVKIRPGFATFIEQQLAQNANATPGRCTTLTRCVGDPAGKGVLLDIIRAYLHRIKDAVDKLVPVERRGTTPVWFLGTAGMRHLAVPEQNYLLDVTRQELRATWEYKTNDAWIHVLDGKREGLFSWIVLNQLLGRHVGNSQKPFENLLLPLPRTVASFVIPSMSMKGIAPATLVEFGGASAQVVSQAPVRNMNHLTLEPLSSPISPLPGYEDYIRLHFCGDSTIIYVKSFQGYGRQLALQTFIRRMLERVPRDHPQRIACLPPDVVFPRFDQEHAQSPIEDIGRELTDEERNNPALLERLDGVLGLVNGTYNACREAVGQTLLESVPSVPLNISPEIEITGNENIYYFHKLVAIPKEPKSAEFTLEWFRNRAKALCSANSVHEIKLLLHPKAEPEKATTGCFGLTFMTEFLEKVVNVEPSRKIHALSKVAGIDVAWPAGHLLVELPGILRSNPDFWKIEQVPMYRDEL